jgi:phenylacetate-CoA ligase
VPDGVPGVLVLTHLDKQAHPLVRWWTGDTVVRDSAPCPCGRTHARLPGGVRGRADDVLVVRGVNVFASAIEEVLFRSAAAGEYEIVLDDEVRDRGGYLTGIKLRVEAAAGQTQVSQELRSAIREELGVSAVVAVLPLNTLPRTMHKARRVRIEPES